MAVDGVIYDLTQSRLWREGNHDPSHGRAGAGRDLTEVIKESPHEELLGSDLDRLSENALTRLALYYILTIYFWINNIWYASVGSTSFSDSLLKVDTNHILQTISCRVVLRNGSLCFMLRLAILLDPCIVPT